MQKKYNYGFAIKKLRVDRNLELKDLAALSGVSYSILRQTEAGDRNNPTAKTITRVADALGVSKQYIFDLAELAPEKTKKNKRRQAV